MRFKYQQSSRSLLLACDWLATSFRYSLNMAACLEQSSAVCSPKCLTSRQLFIRKIFEIQKKNPYYLQLYCVRYIYNITIISYKPTVLLGGGTYRWRASKTFPKFRVCWRQSRYSRHIRVDTSSTKFEDDR